MPPALLLELYSLQCTSKSIFIVLWFIRARCIAVSRMTKDFPEAEFGPNIPFREYSLPDNPKAISGPAPTKTLLEPAGKSTTIFNGN